MVTEPIDCWPCAHYSREWTGPNAWTHRCIRRMPTFPKRCPHYSRDPGSDDEVPNGSND